MSISKGETALRNCLGDIVVRMRKVMAIPQS